MSKNTHDIDPRDLQALTGKRLGPYLSFNPVSRTQIWQWCSAMGDNNPLYLNDEYRSVAGFDEVVAPPAMMQMWTMRDVNMEYPSGSTSAPPYQVFDTLSEFGFPGNVAVSYDITFHRLLLEGARPHHYTTIVAISDLKQTALGKGYFITEQAEFLDEDEALFAQALITYFQYQPATEKSTAATTNSTSDNVAPTPEKAAPTPSSPELWHSDHQDVVFDTLCAGDALPELLIPITHKLIVSGAAATQDYIDVHHNVPAAHAAAMPDIFMNILTTSGLCARYLSDWAGPGSRLQTLAFKLLAPNVPGDTMILQGRVAQLEPDASAPQVTVEFAGRNDSGFHVTGSALLALAN